MELDNINLIKKILVCVPDFRRKGGVANYFRALQLNNYDNIEYILSNDVDSGSTLSKTITLCQFYYKFMISIHKFEACHFNVTLEPRSYYRDMILILLCRFLKVKIIVFFHGWKFPFEKKITSSLFQQVLFKHSYGHMDACIVLGKIFREKLSQFRIKPTCRFFLESTVADDEYIDEILLESRLSKPITHFKILFISRIETTKGTVIAMDAFSKFLEKIEGTGISAELIMAGEGPDLTSSKDYARSKSIPHIQFPGYVVGYDKHLIMLGSHILLFPTYYPEGLPLTILEAMLYGLPVISRINAGIPDVIEQGINGFLTESKDSDVFCDYLLLLIKDTVLYQNIALANHQKAKSLFVKEKIRSRILTIYQQTLG